MDAEVGQSWKQLNPSNFEIMVPSGRQFKELSTDAKIISMPILFAKYPNRSRRYLAVF